MKTIQIKSVKTHEIKPNQIKIKQILFQKISKTFKTPGISLQIAMFRTVVAMAVFSCLVYGWPDNDFNGISHVALVVNNLDEATKFYTDLGGMHVNKLSTGIYIYILVSILQKASMVNFIL